MATTADTLTDKELDAIIAEARLGYVKTSTTLALAEEVRRHRDAAYRDLDKGTYVVITIARGRVSDCEVLDELPQWDWLALGQVVRIGNVNGGDSAPVEMPAENRGRGLL